MLTVVIPTYRREAVLIETIERLLDQSPPPFEILVVDQTPHHEPETDLCLATWHDEGRIVWIRLERPSIARAMNAGLVNARNDIALFVDDDVVPEPGLIAAHIEAHRGGENVLIAGRIIQPWQEGQTPDAIPHFHFAQTKSAWIDEFMGGNFSVDRRMALALGGFDENFVRVAYRFEAEFAWRWLRSGRRIKFEPAACLHHLKVAAGGTRSYGAHLTSYKPDHAVGAYYHLLRTTSGVATCVGVLTRAVRAIANRHHLRRPWWVPATLIAEVSGMIWAARLAYGGPRYADAGDGRQIPKASAVQHG